MRKKKTVNKVSPKTADPKVPFRDKYDDLDIFDNVGGATGSEMMDLMMNRTNDYDFEEIVTGYDPMFVIFHDNGIHRSFETDIWHWDFGDYVYYGYHKNELDSSTVIRSLGYDSLNGKFDNHTVFGMFELSGDDVIATATMKDDGLWAAMQNQIDSVQTGGHLPIMYPWRGDSYPVRTQNTLHYTGSWFINNGPIVDPTLLKVSIDNGCLYSTLDSQCVHDNYVRDIGTANVPAGVSQMVLPRDSCDTDGNRTLCVTNDNNTLNNSVYHVYKGAGVYPVTMENFSQWLDNNNTRQRTQGRQAVVLNSGMNDNDKYSRALVVVRPVCHCLSGLDISIGPDTIGITADDFSCASAGTFGEQYWTTVTGQLGIDPVTPRYEGLVSGYGPFVHITTSGDLQPRSFPVTGIEWCWDDWFLDKDCSYDYHSLGDVIGGWSTNWATVYPENYAGKLYHGQRKNYIYDGVRRIYGDHTFTIPGCYSFKVRALVDYSRLPNILWRFVDKPDCSQFVDSGEKILVREVKPRFTSLERDSIEPIAYRKEYVDNNTCNVWVDVFQRLIPGSYPIGRIDWDFGDGSKIASIVRYDYMSPTITGYEDTYLKYSDDENRTSGEVMTNLKVIGPDRRQYAYSCAELDYFEGNGDLIRTGIEYQEARPETWRMYHQYQKHEVDDGTRTISVTAYAEDTRSPCRASITLDMFPVYPDFPDAEGAARVVDTRSYGTGDTLVVLEGEKTKQFYTTKVD